MILLPTLLAAPLLGIALAVGSGSGSVRHSGTGAPNPLTAWVSRPDPSFHWTKEGERDGGTVYRFTSQTWQGIKWEHSLFYYDAAPHSYRPGGLSDAALLHVAGDSIRPGELATARRLSRQSGLPAVVLFDIPNQPLYDREEDELMAYTFQKAIETGDMTWPVLFPMVKATVKAMDVIQAATHNQVHRFVIYGNSKRGWTSWLTAEVGDKRVAGIAPASIDILNVPAQLARQRELWGSVSPMYTAYEEMGQLGPAAVEREASLMGAIDPYTHLQSVKVPILSVRGASDPFWAPDALSLFKDRLPASTWLLDLPNEGHDYRQPDPFFETLAAFARTAAARDAWPHIHASVEDGMVEVETSKRPLSVKLYTAQTDDAVFPSGSWVLRGILSPAKGRKSKRFQFQLPATSKKWTAWFVSAKFNQNVGFRPQTYAISSPITLIKNREK